MSTRGNFFEDFTVGEILRHPYSRTLTEGDRSLYIAIYGDWNPLTSSLTFAQSLGLPAAPLPDLLVFHTIFGQTVQEISLNAVANLGYAGCVFHRLVYPGETLSTETEILGKKESSSLKHGVVYVRTVGKNERGEMILSFTRWVMVHKRTKDASKERIIPQLPPLAPIEKSEVPRLLSSAPSKPQAEVLSGRFFEEFQEGEVIHHLDGVTIEEAEHMLATKLYQNRARVHFNALAMGKTPFGKRLVYGGHVISLARALSLNGLEKSLTILGINSGTHANPTFAGDTLYASSRVLEKRELEGGGALRVQLVAVKNQDPSKEPLPLKIEKEGKEKYHEKVVLDLDYWLYLPKKS